MRVARRAVLWRQFGAAIDMLQEPLLACPDELWHAEVTQVEFWYVAYHTLFWLDLYLSGSAEGFAPPPAFTLTELDPSGLLPERTYTRDELLGYLQHCRDKCQRTIEELTDEQADRRCATGRRELSFFELLLYNLRHVQEHAAQLSLILGQAIGWESHWVAQARSEPGSA